MVKMSQNPMFQRILVKRQNPRKKRKPVKPRNPKKPFLKIFQITSGLSKIDALSDNYKPLFRQPCTTFQSATTIGVNVGSYTQVRIAGDFLSNRKTA
jgi:hypothetical protein